MMTTLAPAAGKTRPLGKCGQWVSGGTPLKSNPSYWNGEIPWFSAKSLKTFDLDSAEDRVTRAGAENGSTLVPPGTVLFVVRGMSLANELRVGITSKESAFNQDLRGIVVADDVDPRYLGRFLKHGNAHRSLVDNASHGTKRLDSIRLKSLPVPLPPLSEQRRIADILDKADAIRRKRREAVEAIRSLPGSAFEEMFGVGEKSAKWELGTIRDLVATVNYGTSAKAGSAGRHPILRMNNITYSGEWDLSDLKYIELPEGDEEKFTVQSGDLLFNRTNSRELVGKTAVFREQEPMAFAGYLVRVRTNERALPDYISGFLNSPYGKATLRHMCKSIVGMANINAQELQEIKLPIPPISAQEEHAAFVKSVRSREQSLVAAFDSASLLFASLTRRAFKGEL